MSAVAHAPDGQTPVWKDDTIYCEATCDPCDVFYEGSEDDDYIDSATRRLRYEAAGRRFLDGDAPFLLSASLRGPFDRASGWVNPWRSKKAERRPSPCVPQSTTPTPTRSSARKSKSKPHQHVEVSEGTVCHLPTPESLKQVQIMERHPYLEDTDLTRVQLWREEVTPNLLRRDEFREGTARADPEFPRKRRAASTEWLKRPSDKRRRADDVELGFVKSPLQKRRRASRVSRKAVNNGAAAPINLNASFISAPESRPKFQVIRRQENAENTEDELNTSFNISFNSAPARMMSPKRISPRRDVRKNSDGHHWDSEDELSREKLAAATLSSPVSNTGNSKKPFNSTGLPCEGKCGSLAGPESREQRHGGSPAVEIGQMASQKMSEDHAANVDVPVSFKSHSEQSFCFKRRSQSAKSKCQERKASSDQGEALATTNDTSNESESCSGMSAAGRLGCAQTTAHMSPGYVVSRHESNIDIGGPDPETMDSNNCEDQVNVDIELSGHDEDCQMADAEIDQDQKEPDEQYISAQSSLIQHNPEQRALITSQPEKIGASHHLSLTSEHVCTRAQEASLGAEDDEHNSLGTGGYDTTSSPMLARMAQQIAQDTTLYMSDTALSRQPSLQVSNGQPDVDLPATPDRNDRARDFEKSVNDRICGRSAWTTSPAPPRQTIVECTGSGDIEGESGERTDPVALEGDSIVTAPQQSPWAKPPVSHFQAVQPKMSTDEPPRDVIDASEAGDHAACGVVGFVGHEAPVDGHRYGARQQANLAEVDETSHAKCGILPALTPLTLVQESTPEPRFSVKSFASFMSPSPQRTRKWKSRVTLESTSLRLPDTSLDLSSTAENPWKSQPWKKRVSWAPLPNEMQDGSSEASEHAAHRAFSLGTKGRGASPPPETAIADLPTSEDSKFHKHFAKVATTTNVLKRRLLPKALREESLLDSPGPYAMAEKFVAAEQLKKQELGRVDCLAGDSHSGQRLLLADESQDPLHVADDIFRDMLQTWDIDAELDQIRRRESTRMDFGCSAVQ